jgi:acyl dehydratase
MSDATMEQPTQRPRPGDVLRQVDGYVLHDYWARMFEDAMAEVGVRRPDEDLNPVFAYLVVLDALDLTSFFPRITGNAVDEGLLNGELEIERRSARGLRPDERYDIVVRFGGIERKRGRTLGAFDVVTIEGVVRGLDAPCELVVRNRILFLRGGAEADPPAELGPPRASQLPPLGIDAVSGEGAKLVVALTRDPSPLHWDEAMVRRLGLGTRPINPGSNNAAYVLRMIRDWAGGYGRIRALRVRFVRRVHVGDRLVAGGRPGRDGAVAAWLERVGAAGNELVLDADVRLDR